MRSIVSHHAYLFTVLNLNKNWICGSGKQGTGWDGSGSARFNETLSRNEQDTVKSVTFSKKVSKTYRSLSPRICFQFQPTVSTCHCDVEEQPTKPCSPCREQRAGGDRAAHAGEGSGQGGRSRSALLPCLQGTPLTVSPEPAQQFSLF